MISVLCFMVSVVLLFCGIPIGRYYNTALRLLPPMPQQWRKKLLFPRRQSHDLHGVDAGGGVIADGLLHKAVAGDLGHIGKNRGDNPHPQMRPRRCFFVPDVQMAIVMDFQTQRRKRPQLVINKNPRRIFCHLRLCRIRHYFAPAFLCSQTNAAIKKQKVAAG